MRKLLFSIFVVLCFCSSVLPVLAQGEADIQQLDRSKQCDYAFEGDKQKCLDCLQAGNAWTVLGCLPSEPTGFSAAILRFVIGIAGGIAFLTMIAGSFQVITSAGDPEKLKKGKANITKAAVGLLIVIFAIFILRTIGQQILGLPGL